MESDQVLVSILENCISQKYGQKILEIIKSKDEKIISILLDNPNTPSDVLPYLYEYKSDELRRKILLHQNCPEIVYEDFFENEKYITVERLCNIWDCSKLSSVFIRLLVKRLELEKKLYCLNWIRIIFSNKNLSQDIAQSLLMTIYAEYKTNERILKDLEDENLNLSKKYVRNVKECLKHYSLIIESVLDYSDIPDELLNIFWLNNSWRFHIQDRIKLNNDAFLLSVKHAFDLFLNPKLSKDKKSILKDFLLSVDWNEKFFVCGSKKEKLCDVFKERLQVVNFWD